LLHSPQVELRLHRCDPPELHIERFLNMLDTGFDALQSIASVLDVR
jgi:hypothetical protein